MKGESTRQFHGLLDSGPLIDETADKALIYFCFKFFNFDRCRRQPYSILVGVQMGNFMRYSEFYNKMLKSTPEN
ncbi:MAG: hypothetical protein M5F18_08250 [Asgard group archaeon]|nr:hypothetical protein [Asgard group archaeon]